MPAQLELVRESFTRQGLMRTLRAELTHVARGEVTIALPCDVHVSQQGGVVHAGAIAAIADSACGYAAMSQMPDGCEVVSVEFKLNLLEPARGHHVEARARVVRAGRRITVCAADVFAIQPSRETLVATMTGTMLAISDAGGTMAKDRSNQGGPTQSPKDEPTADRAHSNATSREELQERSVKGARPGKGKRNGSDKER